jgi:hypothetical protein
MYSERFTLFKTTTLWESQTSKGPKKFQAGPRRKVPRKIRVTQRIKKPKRKGVMAHWRSVKV